MKTIIITILSVILCGCYEPVKSGRVIEKIHKLPEVKVFYEETRGGSGYVPFSFNPSRNMITEAAMMDSFMESKIASKRVYYPERWAVRIVDAKISTLWWVSEQVYNSIEVNSLTRLSSGSLKEPTIKQAKLKIEIGKRKNIKRK